MRAIPRFLAPSILKSSQRGKFAPEPTKDQLLKDGFVVNTILKEADLFCPNSVRINFTIYHKDKERSIDFSFKNRLEEKLSDYIVILEPGKLATMGIINAHKELAIIGSDVKDWSTYSSSNLPEIKFKIETFKKFVELNLAFKQCKFTVNFIDI
ncbi:hypothetical protein [Lacticaseibacillus paracasei]|uniref:Uncharacterized protein n=2 Tax=Bacilli TaxID=91061 RepID=A0A8B3H8H2_LACPA|nr:hypothetical protein [Lacticaseibacillus paracasei]RNE24831.1 hypothetical protein FAM6012_03083 [Lacticaseibacillus paracasei]